MSGFLYKVSHDSRFWVAIVTAAVIALKTAVPTVPLDETTLSTLFLTAIFAIFGITAVNSSREIAKQFSQTLLDMQKMHQEDMKTLYARFVK